MILITNNLGEDILIDGPGELLIKIHEISMKSSSGFFTCKSQYCLLFKPCQKDSSHEFVLYFSSSNDSKGKEACITKRDEIIEGFKKKQKYFDFSQ